MGVRCVTKHLHDLFIFTSLGEFVKFYINENVGKTKIFFHHHHHRLTDNLTDSFNIFFSLNFYFRLSFIFWEFLRRKNYVEVIKISYTLLLFNLKRGTGRVVKIWCLAFLFFILVINLVTKCLQGRFMCIRRRARRFLKFFN